MAGHLFVTRGDLLHLACDVILVPSGTDEHDRRGHVVDPWAGLVGMSDGFAARVPQPPDRVVKLRAAEGRMPAVWLGHTGETGTEPAEWYAEAIVEFIRRAGVDVPAVRPFGQVSPPPDGRLLLGIPLVGTGEGGMSHDKGGVVQVVLDHVHEELQRTDVDVVLVVHDAADHSAVQQARVNKAGWWDLDDGHLDAAEDLARRARRGELVLFTGAGTGYGAGLPMWKDLIDGIGAKAGLNDIERTKLARLDQRDAATLLRRRLEANGGNVAAAVKELVDKPPHVSLVHQLLASLPVSEAVTTNYDCCFEHAWRDAGRTDVAVLPKDTSRRRRNWLLKLHGSVDDPERIVLSRDDYLRFESDGVALAGLVQAMLLTRHLLFVGYSLSDDNFHRLVHQTRAAIGATDVEVEAFGTALTLEPPGFFDELWTGRVEVVSTADEGQLAARALAILLDRIGALAAAPAAHLLNLEYDRVFDDDERALRTTLQDVLARAERLGKANPLRQAVEEAIAGLADPSDPG